MASGQLTAASQVLRRYNSELVKAISAADPLGLALELYSKEFVGRDITDTVASQVYTTQHKAYVIVSAVERKVEADPSLFHQFTTLLQNEGDSTLKSLGNKLHETYGYPPSGPTPSGPPPPEPTPPQPRLYDDGSMDGPQDPWAPCIVSAEEDTSSGGAGAPYYPTLRWEDENNQPRKELKVKFMNEILTWRRTTYPKNLISTDDILSWANEWSRGELEGIVPKFKLWYPTDEKGPDIRVCFKSSVGSESLIGTKATTCGDKPSMILNLYKNDDDYRKYVVIHEFGHALGLGHEHQTSRLMGALIKSEVLKMLDEWGVKGRKAAQKYQTDYVQYSKTSQPIVLQEWSEFDPMSIMCYPIPARCFEESFKLKIPPEKFEKLTTQSYYDRTSLSKIDKETIKKLYYSSEYSPAVSNTIARALEYHKPGFNLASERLVDMQIDPPFLATSHILNVYAEYLRAVYTQSEFPACSKWPLSPSKKFIKTAIINKAGITKKEADEFTRATLHGDIDQILKKKDPIHFNKILHAEHGEKLKYILVEGAPGIGKSVLVWQICKKWGEKELFQKYSIILLVRLRDNRVHRATHLADLFYHPDSDTQNEVAKEVIRLNGKGTLIILEGLDELPTHLFTESPVFSDLLSGIVLPQATILITSRPSGTGKLWENWKQQVSRHIEIIGFTDKDISEYVQSILPEQELSNFNNYLSIHPHIKSMLYVPLHCAIATLVYSQCYESHSPPPRTLTVLYNRLTQTLLIRYLNSHSDYKGKDYKLDAFNSLPTPVHTDFLSLCKLAFEGVTKQQQTFHDQLNHLGFMDAVPELYLQQQSASYSYKFLHLSVQEYLAAYHLSLMTTLEQEEFLCTIDYSDRCFNMVHFLAGISHFKGLNKAIVRNAIGIGTNSLSMESLKVLYECQDVTLLDRNTIYRVSVIADSMHELEALNYSITCSSSKWEIEFENVQNTTAEPLCDQLRTGCYDNYSIIGISYCDPDFTYCLLQSLPEHTILSHIKTLAQDCRNQSLSPCLPQLISRMERLDTLALMNVPDTSLTELIRVLPKVHTLEILALHKLNSDNIATLCQWLPTCQLKTLIFIEEYSSSYSGLVFSSETESIRCNCCTVEFIEQILPQIPQQSLAQVKILEIYSILPFLSDNSRTLPPCIPELISRMERLNTLDLVNVLDTSLTELIPALSKVPTLKTLRLHTLNSEDVALLCQWLPSCQLETLTLCEEVADLVGYRKRITISFSSETIRCHYCTVEFIEQILPQIPQQSLEQVKILEIYYYDNDEPLSPFIDNDNSLPPCIPELIPRMDRLNTLDLLNVHDTSLTELIPALSRAPTLKTLTLHELNSEGIALLCQWLPTCQLQTLTLCEEVETKVDPVVHRKGITISFSSEAIGCYYCTVEFIEQILPKMPQQSLAQVKTLDIDYDNQQPLPPCMPELIPRMERLNTLDLVNVHDTSLTELIPALSRVPTLKTLRLHKLNSEVIALLCQWLPTCQLETLFLCEEVETKVDRVVYEKTIRMSFFSEAILCSYCTEEFIEQILPQIPRQSLAHIKTLDIEYDNDQPLPPCMPELIPRMERLNTLGLVNIHDASLTELIPALSRVPTLKTLRLHKLNSEVIALLCQWLPTCQLETLTLCEEVETKVDTVRYPKRISFSLQGIRCHYCTVKFIEQILPQIPQQSLEQVKILEIFYDNDQPLPPCMPELIPRMERLSTVTLVNVHDTSVTELISSLSGVPSLRNLALHKLNSEGITLLCQWLPTCQLEKLELLDSVLYEYNGEEYYPNIILSSGWNKSFCDSSIETIECENCTEEFINHVQLQQFVSDAKSMRIEYHPVQPLPPCLIQLISRMERLNTLTLETVDDMSLTELIPVLSRVHTLRKLTLPRLNSESIILVCQWLPTCQLEKLGFLDSVLYEYNGEEYYPKIILSSGWSKSFCDSSIETIECENCTEEFINHVQLQQFVSDTKSMRIEYHPVQPLPPCLIQLISRMERLNTLTLETVDDMSLTELIPVLCRVLTLRKLTLPRLNSESIILVCQWLPTCHLEKLMFFDSNLYEYNGTAEYNHTITLSSGWGKSFCDSSIEIIECYNCTVEFIEQILPQIPQKSLAPVKTLEIRYHNDSNQLEIQYHPVQPLPPCLVELLPRMERLNTLTLKNVLDTSVTELIPELSKVPTLRNFHVRYYNKDTDVESWFEYTSDDDSRSDNRLPQSQSYCVEINATSVDPLFDQFLLIVVSGNRLAHITSFRYNLKLDNDMLPMFPCLPELILRMERLNTLELTAKYDTALAELLPALSRLPTLEKCHINT